MSADHLTPETVGALVDGELEPHLERVALLHVQDCHACSLKVLQSHQLKVAAKKAASGRFLPSADAMKRMTARATPQVLKRATIVPFRPIVWSAIAALLLLFISLGAWKQTRQSNALSTELLDQHLASLSDSSAPQVISTDRHTVKPWFQGRLPFSFNIPEPTALPPDTSLQGADLTYIEGKPAALLLFMIHKHRVSVFVAQAGQLPRMSGIGVRSGFNMDDARAAGLEMFAVSDVSPSDLHALLQALVKTQ